MKVAAVRWKGTSSFVRKEAVGTQGEPEPKRSVVMDFQQGHELERNVGGRLTP